jgi:hypothetical protein
VGGRDEVVRLATTDMLAAGRESSEKPSPRSSRRRVENGWIDAGKAERWLEKLERGLAC